jgi:hypothetical protein
MKSKTALGELLRCAAFPNPLGNTIQIIGKDELL